MKRNFIVSFIFVLATSMLMSACNSGNEASSDKFSSEVSAEDISLSSEISSSEDEQLLGTDVSDAISQIYKTPEEYLRYGLADAVEKVEKSIVSIVATASYSSGFYGEYTEEEAGSGIIVSDTGYIATNCHVISNAKKITVVLYDGSSKEAKLVGKDAKTDLAVLKIESEEKLVPAVFGNSATLRVGDFVFAVGNALGKYPGTVSMGIISSLSRTVTVDKEKMEMIQTDASLNEGNSGGGLFDSQGYLAGIVAAKDSNGSSEGLGFAIPADVAKAVLDDIIVYGYVKGRPSLGISTADITSKAEARYYGVDWIGVYISSVDAGGSGDIAGLEPMDYIYSVNEEVVTTTNRLNEILSNCNVGDTLIMEIWRGSTSLDVVLVIGEDKG